MPASTPTHRTLSAGGLLLFAAIILALPDGAQGQIRGRDKHRPPVAGPWDGNGFGDPTDQSASDDAARHRKAQRYYDAGVRLREKGRLQSAKGKFKSVIGLVGMEDGLGRSALGELLQMHEQGMAQIAEARRLFEDGAYREALKLAKQTRVGFANIFTGVPGAGDMPNVSAAAVALIETIEADPRARAAIQEYEAAKRYKKIPRLEAEARKDATKNLDLFKALETIARRFPDCPTGRRCADRVRQIRDDDKTYEIIRGERTRRSIATALDRAEQYERNGLSKEAAAEYARLRKRFPDKSLAELRRIAQTRHTNATADASN